MRDKVALHTNLTQAIAHRRTGALLPRNIVVSGRRTSARLEPATWEALLEICEREKCNIHQLCTWVDQRKEAGASLTAAIRVFAMAYFREASTEDGHRGAGHGAMMKTLRNDLMEKGSDGKRGKVENADA